MSDDSQRGLFSVVGYLAASMWRQDDISGEAILPLPHTPS